MLRVLSAMRCSVRLSHALSTTASKDESIQTMRSRLIYQSKKRGILENDIILGQFAVQRLEALDRPTLEAYDKLINGSHMEWDLYYYLSGKKPAPSELVECQAFQLLKAFVDEKKVPRKTTH